jgi:hypothetical protein
MKLHFTHPYKDNLELNFGQFTQVVGQDQQLKYYIWQLLIWYFGGKRYHEEDLTLFNQEEPTISSDGSSLKRKFFQVISISEITDLLEQMVYKKGTTSFEFLKQNLNTIDVMSDIDEINARLDSISLKINKRINLSIDNIQYHTESAYFNSAQLLTKSFQPYFKFQENNIAFEFVDNEVKFFLFLEMLEQNLKNKTTKILLVLKNMDDYLTYSSFIKICKKIEVLCELYPYFYVIIFPSNEGYLYATKNNIEQVNIVSEYVNHFYEFDFLFNRFINQYPSNEIPSERDFLLSISKISGYLFSKEIEHVSLSNQDLVTIKILNSLYQYNQKLNYLTRITNPLEMNFLLEKH